MNPTPNHSITESLLDERQVAQLLNISVATLRRRRLLKLPPDWLKIGASVRYQPATIAAFLKTTRCGATSGNPPGADRQRVSSPDSAPQEVDADQVPLHRRKV